jgi:uncharacterized protein (TIGR00255 family)
MTLFSMTGFGRGSGKLSDRLAASAVLRSVNHRYLDIQVRTNFRDEVPEIEGVARSVASDRFQRGRVNVQLNFEWQRAPGVSVTVNTEAVGAVIAQLGEVTDSHGNHLGPVGPGEVLGVPGLIMTSSPTMVFEGDELSALEGVLAEAADAAAAMRAKEGQQIGRQIQAELDAVTAFVDWFEPQMPEFRQTIFDRTRDKIHELTGPDTTIDPERLAQEAALLADRADVAEEVVRLRAHLETFGERLAAGGVVGRTLDFLCQEIHRELNTLGSKCRELGVAERVVDAKTAAERVREQVQNLE